MLSSESLLPSCHLIADGADAANGALRLRETVADLQEEVALLGQFLLGRGDARIADDLDGLRQRLVTDCQFRRVVPGRTIGPADRSQTLRSDASRFGTPV